MSVHHDNLLKMLVSADSGPVVLSPSGKQALRWALSMINVLGDQIADQTGLPIPVVLERASKIVEQDECNTCGGTGKVNGGFGPLVACGMCNGSGIRG